MLKVKEKLQCQGAQNDREIELTENESPYIMYIQNLRHNNGNSLQRSLKWRLVFEY